MRGSSFRPQVALATQALSDIEPRLAFAVSNVYTVQRTFEAQQSSFMQGAFTPSTFAAYRDATGLAGALASYFEDVNIQEPRLLKLYDGFAAANRFSARRSAAGRTQDRATRIRFQGSVGAATHDALGTFEFQACPFLNRSRPSRHATPSMARPTASRSSGCSRTVPA